MNLSTKKIKTKKCKKRKTCQRERQHSLLKEAIRNAEEKHEDKDYRRKEDKRTSLNHKYTHIQEYGKMLMRDRKISRRREGQKQNKGS